MLPLLRWQGNLITPKRNDLPPILSVALLHMSAFSTFAAVGQQFLPASKAIVLGYTIPLWVAVGAPFILREAVTRWRALGIALGLAGLAVIFNPHAFDWSDTRTMAGTGLVLLAALFWSANIIYLRLCTWSSTPLQLLIWQVLLASIVLSGAALVIEGPPRFAWSGQLVLLLLYGGLVGTALAYWAMSMVNRSLSAITTSLGVLLTPLVGIASASLTLRETIDPSLIVAAM